MRQHAERLEFEEAARMRDQVRAIEKTVERQTVLHHWGIDQDVFGLYREGGFIEAIVLMVRGGKLTNTQGWSFQDLEFADEDILADLLTQFYAGARIVPDEVIVPVALEDAEVRAELLTERRGKKVEFLVPQRGEKLRLLEMAMDNARQSFAARRDNENTRERMLEELRTRAPSAQHPQAHRVLRHLQPAGLDGGRRRRRPSTKASRARTSTAATASAPSRARTISPACTRC